MYTPGHKKIGGRRRGGKNKTSLKLKEAILRAASLTGEDGKGKDGLLGYLKSLAADDTKSFSTLLGKVLPMTVSGGDDPIIHKFLVVNSPDGTDPDDEGDAEDTTSDASEDGIDNADDSSED